MSVTTRMFVSGSSWYGSWSHRAALGLYVSSSPSLLGLCGVFEDIFCLSYRVTSDHFSALDLPECLSWRF